MVQKIRTSLIVSLTVINLICILAIFMLINFNKSEIDYDNNFYIKDNEHRRTNKTNLLKYKGLDEILPTKNYFIDYSVYYSTVLILNSICLFFWFFLICTFCVGESDCTCGGSCCDSSCNCGNCGDCCDCNSANGDAGKVVLLCLLFVCIILSIYYSLKCCGKHIARYISLTCTAFINLFILILSSLVLDRESNQIFYIILFSCISTTVNLISIILPNLQSCERLRFRSRAPPSQIINCSINQNNIPQMNNNVIMYNNNMNNYNFNNVPIQANYVVYPNNYNTNVGPVVNYESKPNIEKNITINNSNDSNNQFVMDNSNDMGDAPLPANEMQVKK